MLASDSPTPAQKMRSEYLTNRLLQIGDSATGRGVYRLDLSGEPPGTRTQGPRLKRAMLYRLS